MPNQRAKNNCTGRLQILTKAHCFPRETSNHRPLLAIFLGSHSWSQFSAWDLAEIAAAVFVSVGCIGEMYWLFSKGPRKEEWLRHEEFEFRKTKWEKFFALVVAIGVTVEVVTLIHGLPEAANLRLQVASLESTNLVMRSNVAALEFRLAQTSSNVVRIDPQNLPITSVRANVLLFVRGTNVWQSIDPVKNNRFVDLWIGNRDWMQKNNSVKLILVCKSFEKYLSSDETEWVLEFGPDPMPGATGASWNLTPGDSVRSADGWDFLLMHLPFLRNRSEITRGHMNLVVNTTVKQFTIRPQVAEQLAWGFNDVKVIGNPGSNGINVIVGSGP